ncbi:MAG: hypothetical protein GY920_04240 [Aliivibrio sp.]|nr:hypothetical protein [Aliivibrio sp.]
MANDYDIANLGPNTNSTYGDFQYLTCDTIRVDNVASFNKLVVDNNLLVQGNIKTNDVFIGSFDSEGTFTENYKLREKIIAIESDISGLDGRVSALESAGFTNTVDLSGILTRISNLENTELPPVDLSAIELRLTNLEDAELPPVDLSNIESRLTALEGIDFTPPDLSNLTNSITALQTRTGTLESLIGLLNNNNPTDTALENRITNLEAKINALISIYNSIKAIHNMPINL